MTKRFGLVLLLTAGAVACGAISERLSVGSNAIEGQEGGGGNDAAPGSNVDGAIDESDAALEGDGMPSLTFDPRASIGLYRNELDGLGECSSWTAPDAVVTTIPGMSGNACLICAKEGGAHKTFVSMSKKITLPDIQLGTYYLEFFYNHVTEHRTLMATGDVRMPSVTTQPWLPGSSGFQSYLLNWWQHGEGQITLTSTAGATEAQIDLGMMVDPIQPGDYLIPGDCVAFDRIRVARQPAP